MSDATLFIWGVVAFLLSVGPLLFASFLDYREQTHRRQLERAAGLLQQQD